MKTTSNKDMLNAIRKQASEEYREKIPAVTSDEDIMTIADKLADYPTAKNEFIKTLTEKVVRTDFFSRVYSNPLKMLKKGNLPYGDSIEELFVMAAEAKGFFASDQGDKVGDVTATSLLGREKAKVKALYITRNFAYVFKVSISDAQLKSAFRSANGLSELVNQLVGSLTNGAEQREFEDMKKMLDTAARCKYIEMGTTGNELTEKDIPAPQGDVGVKQQMKTIKIDDPTGATPEGLAIAIREYAGNMKFVSSDYNMAGVKTWSNMEDLVFITTPAVMAHMDVNLLAHAFNVSSADIQYRTILVDKLPGTWATEKPKGSAVNTESKPCYGILMDRNFIQAIDTVNESRQFENGRALMTNLFLHKQGILANCYFANAVAFIGK